MWRTTLRSWESLPLLDFQPTILSRLMRSPCCLYIPHKVSNAWNNLYETWYMYYGNWAHFNGVLRESLLTVCVSVCVSFLSLLGKGSANCIPPFIVRQRLGKHVPASTNTGNNRRIVRHVIIYAVCFLPKECLCVCLCIPLSLLGNNTVKMFPRQRRIIGGVTFYRDC
jgi:hypothetical protein